MSAESIEARTHELMSMQKVELARALATLEVEAYATHDAVKAVFAHSEPAPVMEQGTDPEIIDVAPASLVPEVLDPEEAAKNTGGTPEQFASDVIEGADAAPAEPEAQ